MKLNEILTKLQECNVDRAIKTKRIGGQQIKYIPWYSYCKILSHLCGNDGWCWEIIQMNTNSDRLFLVGRLTIIGEDGTLSMDATGTEELNCSSYGDPSSNAESMALRRCCAKFQLGIQLWQKD